MKVSHELPPIYDKESRSLILGSIPSIMSRTSKKYYGNKYNRFWAVLETIYDDDSVDWENFIKKHHLALWDVISSCDIDSSKDSSIKNVVPNDISSLLKKTKIKNIFTLGNKAHELYDRYIKDSIGIEAIPLPSSSSANARLSVDDLIEKYSIIRELTENE